MYSTYIDLHISYFYTNLFIHLHRNAFSAIALESTAIKTFMLKIKLFQSSYAENNLSAVGCATQL